MTRLGNKELESALKLIVNRLVEKLDIEKIVLFGSYAAGKQSRDSDLDLFVLLNTRKKGIERYAMVSEILEPRTIPMDIIVKTPAELKKRRNYFDPFMNRIMRTGKVLYGKEAKS